MLRNSATTTTAAASRISTRGSRLVILESVRASICYNFHRIIPQRPPMQATPQSLELARQVLAIEARGVSELIGRLDGQFLAAVELILNCKGRVIVSGIGKSGHIARKIAST